MRGICGYVRLDGAPADASHAQAMARALVQVGAGDTTMRCDGPAALAAADWAARARVDAAPCLAHDPASGVTIVADARLAGRAALARALAAPDGVGDAALILAAWLRWGAGAAAALDGDFAFVAWEPRDRRVTCVRDRIGVKPLYVHHQPGRLLAFGSSSAAVLALPGVPRTLDEARLADVLVQQLEGVDTTSTFYAAIRRLPPAHLLAVEPAGATRSRYWTLAPATDRQALPRSDEGWARAFRDVLQAAVAEHLDGVARVGCMVSGGLDSSTLAVLARDHLQAGGRGPLMTFSSVDRERPDCAETAAIDAMLSQPGFRPVVTDANDLAPLAATLRSAAWGSEEPFDFMMALVHLQYLQAASHGVEALIDGIDGDTLLGEGNGLARALMAGHFGQVWRVAGALAPVHGTRARQLPRAAAAAARSLFLPARLRPPLQAGWDRRRAARAIAASAIAPAFAARVDVAGRLAAMAALRSRQVLRDPAREAAEALDHPFLASALERYHRTAARHGVAPRHPLLDRPVLALCVDLPDRQRVDRDTKAVLRRAMRGALPAAVLARRDKAHLGFGINLGWVLRPRDVEDTLRRARPRIAPYLDLPRVDAELAAWQARGPGSAPGPVLLGALQVAAWLLGQAAPDP
jgi:asparagine synthase (glutamine-hydrolysing)